jgi:hypothetical protein
MADDALTYEEYQGFGGRTGSGLVLCAVFVIFASVEQLPVGLRIAFLVVFGGTGALLIAHAVSHRIALRVDAEGVTMGGTPLRYRSTTKLVPWSDIERIVVWQRRMPRGGPLLYVGLAGGPNAPRPEGPAARAAARANALAAPTVPGGTYLAIRAVTGWHLGPARLAAATARFAPTVQIQA